MKAISQESQENYYLVPCLPKGKLVKMLAFSLLQKICNSVTIINSEVASKGNL